jgi:phage-related protein
MQFEVIMLAPAIDFVRSLEPKLQGKTLRSIEMLKHFGPQLPMPHSRKLSGHNLWELRARHASNIVRLFYFHLRHTTYVIASGYVKKSERTKVEEVQRALRLKEEFLQGDHA